MNNIYDPDIQHAPMYCVGFQLQDEHQKETLKILNRKGNIDFSIMCAVYVPNSFKEHTYNQHGRLFFTCLNSNGIVVDQKIGELPLETEKSSEPSLIRYAVRFNFSDFAGSELNLQIAWTNKHDGEMGIGESLRIGRFVNTMIPVIAHHDGDN